ncbi:VirB4 family type IV secretion system protein [Alicyclobacillus fodiniaquatilis]|uniref:VirB4 family type IV secretion system protein n=1 Tax=Alicyclobacillus fodiniaquatilis TaxID=1661150 RepID=A0ABW4JGQ4_9BACL
MLGIKSKKQQKADAKDKMNSSVVSTTTDQDEIWGEYAPTLQDVISTASKVEFFSNHVEIKPNTFKRTYYITRMPNRVHFGFLNQFFRFGADVDISVHVEPADSLKQIREISNTIATYEAQVRVDLKADRTENVTTLRRKIDELDALRAALQSGDEKMYYLSVLLTVSAETQPALEKACSTIEREGPGRGFQLMDAADEQQEGMLSVAPIGLNKLRYPLPVFGSFLANMFPFTSSQFSHKRGVLVGFDLVSGAPMFYDAWHDKLTNANMCVFGVSGSGKSYYLKGLICHSLLHNIQQVVLDWEGEYSAIAKGLGGAVISIDYDSTQRINPCDLEEEEVFDEVTGKKVTKVDVREKIEEMANFTKYAATLTGFDPLTGAEMALIDRLWHEVYVEDFKFTEDPNSLYNTRPQMQSGRLKMRERKPQPQFSDFYVKLRSAADQDQRFLNLADRLERVCSGRTLGLFDTQSTLSLSKKPLIVFDLSKLSENSDLRKLGMFVALEWILEKFIKKNPSQKKRVLVDEAQKALENKDKTPAGEYAAMFLDNAFTRIRKRGGSAVAASQSFRVFSGNAYGQSIIRNSETKVLLKQDRQDEEALKEMFNLDQHELQQLYDFQPGYVRWDAAGEIVYSYYEATPAEDRLWSTKTIQSEGA